MLKYDAVVTGLKRYFVLCGSPEETYSTVLGNRGLPIAVLLGFIRVAIESTTFTGGFALERPTVG